MKNLSTLLGAGLLLGLFAATPATAALISPEFRGDPNTEYSYWDIFVDEYTDPGDIGTPGAGNPVEGGTGSGILYQTGTNTAFLTGSNIYSFEAATGFELHDTPGFTPGLVLFQFRTAGNEMDYSSLFLDINGTLLAPDATLEVSREGSGMSGVVEYAVQWDLSDNAALFAGGNDYIISFNAPGPHASFQYASLDVSQTFQSVIPEPDTGLLFGATILVLTLLRRRRRVAA